MLREEPLEILSEADFVAEREASVQRQKKVEAADSEPFERYWRGTRSFTSRKRNGHITVAKLSSLIQG